MKRYSCRSLRKHDRLAAPLSVGLPQLQCCWSAKQTCITRMTPCRIPKFEAHGGAHQASRVSHLLHEWLCCQCDSAGLLPGCKSVVASRIMQAYRKLKSLLLTMPARASFRAALPREAVANLHYIFTSSLVLLKGCYLSVHVATQLRSGHGPHLLRRAGSQ